MLLNVYENVKNVQVCLVIRLTQPPPGLWATARTEVVTAPLPFFCFDEQKLVVLGNKTKLTVAGRWHQLAVLLSAFLQLLDFFILLKCIDDCSKVVTSMKYCARLDSAI